MSSSVPLRPEYDESEIAGHVAALTSAARALMAHDFEMVPLAVPPAGFEPAHTARRRAPSCWRTCPDLRRRGSEWHSGGCCITGLSRRREQASAPGQLLLVSMYAREPRRRAMLWILSSGVQLWLGPPRH
jgi:hypothetical protein